MAEPTTAPEAAPAPVAESAPPVDEAPPSLSAFEAELEAIAAAAVAADPNAAPEAPAADPAKPPEATPALEPAPTDAEKRARAILATATRKEADALVKAKSGRDDLIALAKASPQKFLAEVGMTVDQFLRAIQAEGEPAPEPEPKAMIQELRDRLDNADKAAKQKAAQAETARLTSEIHAEIKASPKYPLTNAAGWHDQVTDLMIGYFERHCMDSAGNVLPDAKPLDRHIAAAQVEEHLASLAGKLKIQPQATAASNGTATSNRPASPTLATLSPRDVAPTDDGLPTDPDERLAAVEREIAQLQ